MVDVEKNTAEENKVAPASAAPRLGLSKVVYALGESAKDAFAWGAVAFVALLPVIYYGRKHKVPGVQTLASIPEKFRIWKHKMLAGGASKFGAWFNPEVFKAWFDATVVSALLSTMVGYIAHVPGLVRGPAKFARAEKEFNSQVHANVLLKEENDKLKTALAEAQEKRLPYTQTTKVPSEQVNSRA